MTALKQEQLFDEIDVLPIDLKTKIVDKILNSINPIDKSIDDLWIKEVNKRKDEIARLIAGSNITEKTMEHATEIIELAKRSL